MMKFALVPPATSLCLEFIEGYINDAGLSNPLPRVTSGYLVAHELEHIATGSTKEKDADAWAKARGYRFEHKDNRDAGLI